MMKKSIYVMGSLKNPEIPNIGNELRKLGFDVFDDWFSPGPEADDFWRKYEKIKGSTYGEALHGWAGKHIFEFDKFHLDRCDIGVLVMPAGKSCHMELGYMIGSGKKCYVLFDEEYPRWDVMYIFCIYSGGNVCFSMEELIEKLRNE
jgi:nucleoside 2-deoxyribosyltransferase